MQTGVLRHAVWFAAEHLPGDTSISPTIRRSRRDMTEETTVRSYPDRHQHVSCRQGDRHMPEIMQLLAHVVARQAVTRHPGAIGTKTGFASAPPIDLDALELRDDLARSSGSWHLQLEGAAMELIERPGRVPLGLCVCGTAVSCEFDRVAAQCRGCGEWLSRADAVAAAREYVEEAWLTPAEIEHETRGWGTPVRAGRVRLWRHRGRIEADEQGRYRLADVLAVLDRQAG
jgi:hypothetical protein